AQQLDQVFAGAGFAGDGRTEPFQPTAPLLRALGGATTVVLGHCSKCLLRKSPVAGSRPSLPGPGRLPKWDARDTAIRQLLGIGRLKDARSGRPGSVIPPPPAQAPAGFSDTALRSAPTAA